MKSLALYGGIVSVIGAFTITASPAAAFTFGVGDFFSGSADFQRIGTTGNNLDFLGGSTPGTGDFMMSRFTPTGAFAPFAGRTGTILDTNFVDGANVSDFLTFAAIDSSSGWSMSLQNIQVLQSFDDGPDFRVAADTIFLNDLGHVAGVGRLSGELLSGPQGTVSMSYEVTSVPEPLTLLGTGMAIGFGGLFKRELDKRKKSQV